jgi:hypothetical protein
MGASTSKIADESSTIPQESLDMIVQLEKTGISPTIDDIIEINNRILTILGTRVNSVSADYKRKHAVLIATIRDSSPATQRYTEYIYKLYMTKCYGDFRLLFINHFIREFTQYCYSIVLRAAKVDDNNKFAIDISYLNQLREIDTGIISRFSTQNIRNITPARASAPASTPASTPASMPKYKDIPDVSLSNVKNVNRDTIYKMNKQLGGAINDLADNMDKLSYKMAQTKMNFEQELNYELRILSEYSRILSLFLKRVTSLFIAFIDANNNQLKEILVPSYKGPSQLITSDAADPKYTFAQPNYRPRFTANPYLTMTGGANLRKFVVETNKRIQNILNKL